MTRTPGLRVALMSLLAASVLAPRTTHAQVDFSESFEGESHYTVALRAGSIAYKCGESFEPPCTSGAVTAPEFSIEYAHGHRNFMLLLAGGIGRFTDAAAEGEWKRFTVGARFNPGNRIVASLSVDVVGLYIAEAGAEQKDNYSDLAISTSLGYWLPLRQETLPYEMRLLFEARYMYLPGDVFGTDKLNMSIPLATVGFTVGRVRR